MKKFILLFAICCAMSSCASLLNRDTFDLTLYSEIPATITYKKDTLHIDSVTPRLLTVGRDNKPLMLRIESGTHAKAAYTDRKYDCLFYAGFLTVYGAVVDYAAGIRNKRIYSYSNPLLINKNLELVKAKKLPKLSNKKESKIKSLPTKDDIYLGFSIPIVNLFNFIPNKENRKHQTTMLGISTGADYFYRDNRFISINAGVTLSPLHNYDAYYSNDNSTLESTFTADVNITHNHRYKDMDFGYGMSLNHHYWSYEKITYTFGRETLVYDEYFYGSKQNYSEHYKEKTHQSLGFVFTGNYFFSNSFYTGIIYRPSFIRFNTDKTFGYEHLLSFTLGFKIRLKKGKDKK